MTTVAIILRLSTFCKLVVLVEYRQHILQGRGWGQEGGGVWVGVGALAEAESVVLDTRQLLVAVL